MAICFCASVMADDTMSSTAAHEKASEEAKSLSLSDLKHKSTKYLIVWELSPSYKLTKDDIIKLVKEKKVEVESEWAKGTLTLKEGHNHPALLWAKDDAPKDISDKEEEYFKNEEPLLLESGEWNGTNLVYHYRWQGDVERNKSIAVNATIEIKDKESDIGKFLEDTFEHIRNEHKEPKKPHHSSTPAQPPASPVFAQQQPSPTAPPQIIYQQSSPPAPYYGYPYGPPIGIGIWGGYGYGHGHGHHHGRW